MTVDHAVLDSVCYYDTDIVVLFYKYTYTSNFIMATAMFFVATQFQLRLLKKCILILEVSWNHEYFGPLAKTLQET